MGNATNGRVLSWGFGGNQDVERGVLEGRVTATLRTRREAEPGDTVRARNLGTDLVIDNVQQGRIADLLAAHYSEMGFASERDAAREWRLLHPHIGVSGNGWLHRFRVSPFPLQQESRRKEVKHGAGV